MRRLLLVCGRFQAMLRDEHGATMIEYALMVAFIAAIAVAGVTALGTTTNGLFVGASLLLGIPAKPSGVP